MSLDIRCWFADNQVKGRRNDPLEVIFADDGLHELENNERCRSRFSSDIVRAYRRLLRFIRDARDERDLRAWPGKHFEKLKGDRSHQYSMKIDSQWRLIFEIEGASPKNVIHIIEIADYH
jgi:proteic killer suppression protein